MEASGHSPSRDDIVSFPQALYWCLLSARGMVRGPQGFEQAVAGLSSCSATSGGTVDASDSTNGEWESVIGTGLAIDQVSGDGQNGRRAVACGAGGANGGCTGRLFAHLVV